MEDLLEKISRVDKIDTLYKEYLGSYEYSKFNDAIWDTIKKVEDTTRIPFNYLLFRVSLEKILIFIAIKYGEKDYGNVLKLCEECNVEAKIYSYKECKNYYASYISKIEDKIL